MNIKKVVSGFVSEINDCRLKIKDLEKYLIIRNRLKNFRFDFLEIF